MRFKNFSVGPRPNCYENLDLFRSCCKALCRKFSRFQSPKNAIYITNIHVAMMANLLQKQMYNVLKACSQSRKNKLCGCDCDRAQVRWYILLLKYKFRT